jgi:FkbM family methyltransferase
MSMSKIQKSLYGGSLRLISRNLLLATLPERVSLKLNYIINFILRPLDQNLNKLCKYLAQIPQPVVLDIGGNIGLYAYAFSKVKNSSVFVYEPQPWNISYLKAAFNSINNVLVHPYGLSSSTEVATISIPFIRSLGPLGRLDALASLKSDSKEALGYSFVETNVELKHPNECPTIKQLSKLDCIKIDVEGHELSVIEGLSAIILKYKPLIYAESSNDNIIAVYELLKDLGYSQLAFASSSSCSSKYVSYRGLSIQEDSNYFFGPC